jgi:hypothetical protein
MTNFLPALAFAFAAFCVWLVVRIVNRRERWTKWTAAGIGVPVLYFLSVGPVIWLQARGMMPAWADAPVEWIYWPIVWMAKDAPLPISAVFWWYAELWGWKL